MRRALPLAVVIGTVLASTSARAEGEDTIKTKSPPMVAAGIGSMTAGSVAVGFGIAFVTLYARLPTSIGTECLGCGARTIPRDSDYLVGGTMAIVGGALAILGGIPLVYFGAKHERVWVSASGIGGTF